MSEQPLTPSDTAQPLRLGDLLRSARAHNDLELSDIAEVTHVRKEYLRALEEGRYPDLPEDVYTRNFLKLYAQAVGLDGHEVLELYRRERQRSLLLTAPPEAPNPEQRHPTPQPQAPEKKRRLLRGGPLLPTLVLVVVITGLAVWGFNSLLSIPGRTNSNGTIVAQTTNTSQSNGGQRSEPSSGNPIAAEVPGTTPGSAVAETVRLSVTTDPPGAEVSIDAFPLPGTTPISNALVTAREARVVRVTLDGYQDIEQTVNLMSDQKLDFTMTPASDSIGESQEAVLATSAPGTISLTITETTWLEVYQSTARNQGKRLVYTTANPGEHYQFKLPVYVHVGNGAGVQVSVGGKDLGALGSRGAVVGRPFSE